MTPFRCALSPAEGPRIEPDGRGSLQSGLLIACTSHPNLI